MKKYLSIIILAIACCYCTEKPINEDPTTPEVETPTEENHETEVEPGSQAQESQEYYWYKDSKIFLYPDSTREAITQTDRHISEEQTAVPREYTLYPYTNDTGGEFYVSNRFYVKLSSQDNMNDLISLIADSDVVLCYCDEEYLPILCVLCCPNGTASDAIRWSNKCHESGLFRYAEPEFAGVIFDEDIVDDNTVFQY